MIRLLLSVVIGASVSFGLFYFMAFLIASSGRGNEDPPEDIRVDVFTTPPKSTTQTKRRVPPPPPPPPKVPPKAPEPEPENDDVDANAFQFNAPSVNVGNDAVSLSGPGSGLGRDGDAAPIVRIDSQIIGNGQPGPVWATVNQLYKTQIHG